MFSLIPTLAPLAALGAFGVLSVRFGHDSRPGFDEKPEPHTHRRDI